MSFHVRFCYLSQLSREGSGESVHQGWHRLEKYLNLEAFLEKSL